MTLTCSQYLEQNFGVIAHIPTCCKINHTYHVENYIWQIDDNMTEILLNTEIFSINGFSLFIIIIIRNFLAIIIVSIYIISANFEMTWTCGISL